MSIGKDWLNVRETANKLKLSESRIRQMLSRGQIAGQKLSERAWAISAAEVERVAKLDRPPGNPAFVQNSSPKKRSTKKRRS
jgi:hypothetical protein